MRPSGGLEKAFSGVWDRRNGGWWSNGDCRVGAVGGDMAAGPDVVGLPNMDDPDGRDKSDDPLSRAGRSGSAPSMAEMDMLLPGR